MSYQIEHFIRRMTDGKYPPDLLERTVYPNDPRGFVYFFHPKRFAPKSKPQGVMECRMQSDAKFKCTMTDSLDALSVGVVTDPQIFELDPELRQSLADK